MLLFRVFLLQLQLALISAQVFSATSNKNYKCRQISRWYHSDCFKKYERKIELFIKGAAKDGTMDKPKKLQVACPIQYIDKIAPNFN